MKKLISMTAVLMIVSTASFAHDPKFHKKAVPQKADCSAIASMDHSKMKQNDPVMQAMMNKCAKLKSEKAMNSSEATVDHSKMDMGNHKGHQQ